MFLIWSKARPSTNSVSSCFSGVSSFFRYSSSFLLPLPASVRGCLPLRPCHTSGPDSSLYKFLLFPAECRGWNGPAHRILMQGLAGFKEKTGAGGSCLGPEKIIPFSFCNTLRTRRPRPLWQLLLLRSKRAGIGFRCFFSLALQALVQERSCL